MATFDFLHLVDRCDNFRLDTTDEKLVPFSLTPSSPPIGFLFSNVVELLREYNDKINRGKPAFVVTDRRICFDDTVNTFEKRSAVMKELSERWRDDGHFSMTIGGRLWRDELFPIYPTPFTRIAKESVQFVMERVCCELFSFTTYGIHMTMYTRDGRIWVPRRSKTKQTWGGYLDNTVAGGIPWGLTPTEALIKESMEEASLSEDVASKAKCAGCITYVYRTTKGFLQVDVQYVYDLCVPAPEELSAEEALKCTPKPLDGEVESFEFLTFEEVLDRMGKGEFKPNCALVLLDFFIRHGIITPENESNFVEIVTRLHGRFGFDAIAHAVN
ncbi:hypothetical protein FRB99_003228 [Tulasnella sp. 403]|nr:hypothetical protein FRB99_003228 [Tulasnella sp. 403]